MNILVLGTTKSSLTPILWDHKCRVVQRTDPIDREFLEASAIDFAVSYRYRHLVRKPVIDYLKGNIINLHISLLPWNRGADPNLWSFLEDTSKGVSIHYMDEGIDTGDIVAQKEVIFERTANETLATTYEKLNVEIIELFKEYWPLIMQCKASRRKQIPGGSFHGVKDKRKFEHLLAQKGWDTPVKEIMGKGLINSETRGVD